jgi:GntR family transcriptional regulator, rspAB operon transcriptional repressor
MVRAVGSGDLAGVVECDTRLHGVLIGAGGRTRLAELWHSLDGQMGALMRSSLEFQGGDLVQVIDRHRRLIEAVATRDRPTIAAALKDHYLDPKTLADRQPDEGEAP